ncbi:MAG TPA: glycosyltransferase family A protein [Verrucomicrobiae bacterium]|jgi:glycosyltransferase involved in cell wall biosynthesis|nr:glycosyltransferase family A protein [Verrucomicrobiae bacterium]
MKNPLFSISTPTYNRSKLLQRSYDSLAAQTFQDFEWLVIDDGSTDNTQEVVAKMAASAKFPIRYIRKANGGKHTCVNLAVREARGALYTNLDSDDWFVPHAFERMKYHWEQLSPSDKKRLTGVVGLYAWESGEILGKKFPSDPLETDDLELKFRFEIHDEKIGFMRTEVMREFPFPELPDHRVRFSVIFCPESIVWNRIGLKYPTRFINEVFAIKEYQSDGITLRGRLIVAENSKFFLMYSQDLLTCKRKLPISVALKCYCNYIRLSLHQNVPWKTQMSQIPSKHLFLACAPAGVFLWRRDRRTLDSYARKAAQSRS